MRAVEMALENRTHVTQRLQLGNNTSKYVVRKAWHFAPHPPVTMNAYSSGRRNTGFSKECDYSREETYHQARPKSREVSPNCFEGFSVRN
jgi:hypothetical protein